MFLRSDISTYCPLYPLKHIALWHGDTHALSQSNKSKTYTSDKSKNVLVCTQALCALLLFCFHKVTLCLRIKGTLCPQDFHLILFKVIVHKFRTYMYQEKLSSKIYQEKAGKELQVKGQLNTQPVIPAQLGLVTEFKLCQPCQVSLQSLSFASHARSRYRV